MESSNQYSEAEGQNEMDAMFQKLNTDPNADMAQKNTMFGDQFESQLAESSIATS